MMRISKLVLLILGIMLVSIFLQGCNKGVQGGGITGAAVGSINQLNNLVTAEKELQKATTKLNDAINAFCNVEEYEKCLVITKYIHSFKEKVMNKLF